MNRLYNPATVPPPRGVYSHACEVPPGARWLLVAGQGGVMPNGAAATGIEAQCDWAMRNMIAVLESAGMTVRDVVRLTALIVHRDYLPTWRAAHRRHFGDHQPPNTTHIVADLANPDWLFEIEALAARSD